MVWNLNMGVQTEPVEEAETGTEEPRPVKMTGQETGNDSRPVTGDDSDLSHVTDKPVPLKPSPLPSNEGAPRKMPEEDASPEAVRVTDALRESLGLQVKPHPNDIKAADRLVREHGTTRCWRSSNGARPPPGTGSGPGRTGSGGAS